MNLSRRSRSLLAALTVLLAGCASQPDNIYGCCVGQQVVGNSAYVSVHNVYNEMDALPLAEKHCSRFRKTARFTQMVGPRAVFHCV